MITAAIGGSVVEDLRKQPRIKVNVEWQHSPTQAWLCEAGYKHSSGDWMLSERSPGPPGPLVSTNGKPLIANSPDVLWGGPVFWSVCLCWREQSVGRRAPCPPPPSTPLTACLYRSARRCCLAIMGAWAQGEIREKTPYGDPSGLDLSPNPCLSGAPHLLRAWVCWCGQVWRHCSAPSHCGKVLT